MKVLNRFWGLVILIAVSFAPTVCAQSNSKLMKELEKKRANAYKEVVKNYEKEGWKLADNNTTMEVAVLEHHASLADPANNFTKFTGEVSKCRSANVGRMTALNNAQNRLAQLMEGDIKGYAASLINADAENVNAEKDESIMGFTKEIKISVAGALKESYAIYKENPDGTLHYKVFYLVDKSKCIAAANRALDKSLKDTKVAIDIADQIRQFVNTGLTVGE